MNIFWGYFSKVFEQLPNDCFSCEYLQFDSDYYLGLVLRDLLILKHYIKGQKYFCFVDVLLEILEF